MKYGVALVANLAVHHNKAQRLLSATSETIRESPMKCQLRLGDLASHTLEPSRQTADTPPSAPLCLYWHM